MADRWPKTHLGSPPGLFFISSFRLHSRARWYSQGPYPNSLSLSPRIHPIQQNKSSLVRFYRDYSIADFAFCAFSLILGTYAAFLGPARAGVCEELSHHPELMRDMLEMGLNLENCERWLERAVFVVLVVSFVIMVVRVSPSPPILFLQ